MPPTAKMKGLSHECGAFASVRVITIGKASSAMMNCIQVNEDMKSTIVISDVRKTKALPSKLRVYFFFVRKAVVSYLCLPKRIPIGSANPSPIPEINIATNINSTFPIKPRYSVIIADAV